MGRRVSRYLSRTTGAASGAASCASACASSISAALRHRRHHLDALAVADGGEALGQFLVGDEGLDLADMGDAHRRAAAELGGVGDQHDAAGIGDDGLRHLHLAIVEVEQRALLVDRGRPDDGVVDLELADQLRRGRADHRTVGAPHRAAGDHHLDAGMAVEQHRDVEIVGDDEEVLVRGQRARHLLGRGADIDEERAAVRDQRGGRGTDRLLLVGGDEPPRLVGEVFDAGGDDGAAVDTGQRAALAEIVEILADRLRRDLEPARELLDHDAARGARDVEDFGLAMGQSGHGDGLKSGKRMVRRFARSVNARSDHG